MARKDPLVGNTEYAWHLRPYLKRLFWHVHRKAERRYTLDELLEGMTPENVPDEIDWGPPRGGEAW